METSLRRVYFNPVPNRRSLRIEPRTTEKVSMGFVSEGTVDFGVTPGEPTL
jgi:hypothetical protein